MKRAAWIAGIAALGLAACGGRSELVAPDALAAGGDGGGSTRDAGLRCGDVVEPEQPVCRRPGRECDDACEAWAQALTRDGRAFAWSGSQSGERCVRGTACTAGAGHACFCGRQRSCERGQVCVALPGEAMPSCRCIAPP